MAAISSFRFILTSIKVRDLPVILIFKDFANENANYTRKCKFKLCILRNQSDLGNGRNRMLIKYAFLVSQNK